MNIWKKIQNKFNALFSKQTNASAAAAVKENTRTVIFHEPVAIVDGETLFVTTEEAIAIKKTKNIQPTEELQKVVSEAMFERMVNSYNPMLETKDVSSLLNDKEELKEFTTKIKNTKPESHILRKPARDQDGTIEKERKTQLDAVKSTMKTQIAQQQSARTKSLKKKTTNKTRKK